MNGLYAIIDAESPLARDLDIVRFATAVAAAHPAVIQLRDKRLGSGDHLQLLRALVPICRAASVPLFANDRADLAVLAGCDGVHVGQTDLPPAGVRKLADLSRRPLAIGMSVHNDAELAIALEQSPDYIAFGPVFGTSSKANPDPTLGVARLARLTNEARAQHPGPRVAIGGITRDNAAQLAPHCDMIAIISALIDDDAPDPYGAATERTVALADAFRAGGTP